MKVGLDVDGVLCNFVQGILDVAHRRGLSSFPQRWTDADHWLVCPEFGTVMREVNLDPGFWLQLDPLPYSGPLDFAPDCYITARPIASWVTEQWLAVHRFPKADLITVADPKDKIDHIRERGLDLFVDDHYVTVPELRAAGVNAVLFEAPYQRGHDVSGLPKIKSLSEVVNGSWEKELSRGC
jgi:uncharacterized HAD superfamily protein